LKQKINYWAGENITQMTQKNIFVFGSNPEGRHGLGAAKTAMTFGAVYRVGRGLQGNTYALVTKHLKPRFLTKGENYFSEDITNLQSKNPRKITYKKFGVRSVTLEQIRDNIIDLYYIANMKKEHKFFIAYKASGNNLNGYSPNDIFAQFVLNIDVPENIRFHNSFRDVYSNLINNKEN
jgi:hypothetical protein